MASRGSVIPLFVEQIQNKIPITVTDPSMTRFMMTLNNAVDLVLYAFENGESGDLFVQKSPAATIDTLVKALLKIYKSDLSVDVIGTRHGEKDHEVLCSREEMFHALDLGEYFKIPADKRDLNYDKYVDKGIKHDDVDEYSSSNTNILDVDELIDLLQLINIG